MAVLLLLLLLDLVGVMLYGCSRVVIWDGRLGCDFTADLGINTSNEVVTQSMRTPVQNNSTTCVKSDDQYDVVSTPCIIMIMIVIK